jgi:2-deoxy-D-gluconate 3-dehydrogenase
MRAMNLDIFSLQGKCALVTGASRGLGQGMAVALARAGADVAAADIPALPPDDTCKQITSLGQRAFPLAGDLGQPDVPEKLFAEAVEKLGRVDILVNNAGIIRRAPAVDFSDKDWDDVIQINLNAVFKLARAAGRHMIGSGRGGKIISTASLLAFQGGILVPSYAAAKGGVAQLTKALANEWASKGINVNAVAPGYMATDNTTALRGDPARSKAILDRIPAGRWGTPEDVATVVVFLASSASDYVNGHVLVVDGGWLAR